MCEPLKLKKKVLRRNVTNCIMKIKHIIANAGINIPEFDENIAIIKSEKNQTKKSSQGNWSFNYRTQTIRNWNRWITGDFR